MSEKYKLIVFILDKNKFSIHLENMESVFRAVEITTIPNSSSTVLGIINMHGEVIPIINIRKKFNLPAKDLSINNKIVVVKTSSRKFGFVVDDIDGYLETTAYTVIKGESVWPGLNYVDEVVKLSDKLILINNPENFFLEEEESEFNQSFKNKTT